ncbi:uncharacterized protein BXZ73DRAFT_44251 [Epithele typhae]|uniref:uncharacterized protein n=1 Tax=Epithele typhae TaxID=378194 RepID=UPI0020083AC5|nr:uncharacterized protein BXZ73DRAFT_44251 [Epithele typhae]KAH9939074.1 hypothetical protein BXZ73DRAFT_44251 [Epithele typhae]
MHAIRAARARDGAPPHGPPSHFHPHSQSVTPIPQAPHSKSQGKQGQPLPGDVPPPFMHERDMKQGPTKGTGSVPMPPPHTTHLIPHQQVQLPGGQHNRQIPPDAFAPGMISGYQSRRPSPPPFLHPGAQSILPFTLPRTSATTPSPPIPIRHLGVFVFPRTPFPFFDFPSPLAPSGAPADALDVRATLFLPARALPLTRPRQPRVWGGALIPAVPPLTGEQRGATAQLCARNPRHGQPWPDEVRDGRRVYTDDSDLFLCALHAGWVTWSGARKARREGRDLRMEVRLTREARYIGGLGAPLRRQEGAEVEHLGADDDGSTLLSSGWGNGHDGAGLEIVKAEFVPAGTAHSYGLRNRPQRMLEYAERRAALGCAPRTSRKRRRFHGPAFADSQSAVQLRANRADDETAATRVMVFGTDGSWPEIGCVSFLSISHSFRGSLRHAHRGAQIQVPPRGPEGGPLPPASVDGGEPPGEAQEARRDAGPRGVGGERGRRRGLARGRRRDALGELPHLPAGPDPGERRRRGRQGERGGRTPSERRGGGGGRAAVHDRAAHDVGRDEGAVGRGER